MTALGTHVDASCSFNCPQASKTVKRVREGAGTLDSDWGMRCGSPLELELVLEKPDGEAAVAHCTGEARTFLIPAAFPCVLALLCYPHLVHDTFFLFFGSSHFC